MAVLVVERGPNQGMQFALQQDATTLGRHPDCDVVLEIGAVSRQHARVLRIGGVYYLEDLHSRNGTRLNDQVVQGRLRLEDGDRVAICDVVFRFREAGGGGGDAAASVVDDLAPNAEMELGERVCVCQETGGSLEQACERVRQSLDAHRLVFHPFTEKSVIQEALLQEDPTAMRILGEGFYRLIVLDVARGLDSRGRFDLADFYEYAFRRLETAFDLQPAEDYHEQDLMQILMDEELSLVCLLNAHVASSEDRQRLRSLTQEQHHALVVYRQAAKPDLERGRPSEPTATLVDDGPYRASTLIEDDFDDMGSAVMSRIDASASPGALDKFVRRLEPRLSQEQVLTAFLDGLFEVYAHADSGLILLRDPESQQLVPRASRSRSGGADRIRISRTVINQVMSKRQAILSADVADEGAVPTSIADFRIRSVICVPIITSAHEPVGVVCLDTLDKRSRFMHEDLGTMTSAAKLLGMALENSHLHEQSMRQASLDRELSLAAEVQRSLLASKPPELPGYEFYFHVETAERLGGDLYDFVPMADGRLAVAVGDIAGKMEAALLVAAMSRDLRFHLTAQPDPVEAVQRLNVTLFELANDRFMTLLLCILDPAGHEMTIVNAGHMPPIVRRQAGNEVAAVGKDASGVPVGVIDDYSYQAFSLPLEDGDTVVLYTDGVSDAISPDDRFYGSDRLNELVRETQGTLTILGETLIADVHRHMAGRPPRDDMCLVCIRRQDAR